MNNNLKVGDEMLAGDEYYNKELDLEWITLYKYWLDMGSLPVFNEEVKKELLPYIMGAADEELDFTQDRDHFVRPKDFIDHIKTFYGADDE